MTATLHPSLCLTAPHPTPAIWLWTLNNTGNQPRPLQLQEARHYLMHPPLTPTALWVLRGLAPPAMHWHNPWPTPVTSLHCSVHSWEDSASPRRACQTAKPRSLQLHVGTDQAQLLITGLYHTHLWLAPSRCAHAQFQPQTAITSLQWRWMHRGKQETVSELLVDLGFAAEPDSTTMCASATGPALCSNRCWPLEPM